MSSGCNWILQGHPLTKLLLWAGNLSQIQESSGYRDTTEAQGNNNISIYNELLKLLTAPMPLLPTSETAGLLQPTMTKITTGFLEQKQSLKQSFQLWNTMTRVIMMLESQWNAFFQVLVAASNKWEMWKTRVTKQKDTFILKKIV